MDIIVEDTNILLDLFKTGLIMHCQKMDISFHTSRQVYREITDSEQKSFYRGLVANGLLAIDSFDGDDFILLTETFEELSKISNLTEADCSVILLAERFKCRLLTADQKLIRQARARGLQANGFLWLTDKMVELQIVDEQSMVSYLQTYLNINQSAPTEEAQERIDRYKSKHNSDTKINIGHTL